MRRALLAGWKRAGTMLTTWSGGRQESWCALLQREGEGEGHDVLGIECISGTTGLERKQTGSFLVQYRS